MLDVSFFKNDLELQSTPLAPELPLTLSSHWTGVQYAQQTAAAKTYNRIGGLLTAVSRKAEIPLENVLSVWMVESGGRAMTPGKAIIRFEVHLFYKAWGKQNADAFDTHFRFGGHHLVPGRSWENHEYRAEEDAPFSAVHHNQNSEYTALTLARMLGGDEPAFSSTSIGGPQILMEAHGWLGYDTAALMYQAFQASEQAQVLGFFDFCHAKPAPGKGDLLRYLRRNDWEQFTRYYNGPGQVTVYSERLQKNVAAVQKILENLSQPVPVTQG